MRFAFILAFNIFATFTYAQDSKTLSHLLKDIEKNALQLKASNDRLKADQIDLERSLFFLRPTAFVRGGYENTDNPPTSPFSPNNSASKELEFGLSKQWVQGLKTSFNYRLEDSQTQFPTRPDFSFISPKMSFSLETNIFQDLIYQRYQNQKTKNKWQKEVINLETKIERKNVLLQGLIDFSMILEVQEELELQKQLCQSIKKQAKNLERKYRRGSVSKREYLLGLKEQTNCQATIELLKRNDFEKTKEYAAKYNIKFNKYSSVQTNQIFREASQIYKNFKTQASQVDIQSQDQLKVLSIQEKSLHAEQKELEAQASHKLNLEFRSGLTGLN